MSITPKLKCPPDYSILSFRFVDCKRVGVVKGISKEVDVDLKDFFIPVSEYSERRFTIKPGQIQKIEAGNLLNFGEQFETYSFKHNDVLDIASDTNHELCIYDYENGLILFKGSFSYVQSTDVPNFAKALSNFYEGNNALNNLVTVNADNTTQKFTIAAKNAGIKLLYKFTYNLTSLSPFHHPGTLTIPYRKWENGRLKVLFLLATIGDKFTPSNQKTFQWVTDDEYQRLYKPNTFNTGIKTNAINTLNEFTWFDTFDEQGNLLSYNARPAYKVFVNDLVRTNKTNHSSFIQSFDGYKIVLSEGIGSGEDLQMLQKIYSPSTITWKTSNELLILTGGEEVYDDDKQNIETIWIKNNQSFDIQFEVIIAS